METPNIRKGIAGWKLTKRPMGIIYDPSIISPEYHTDSNSQTAD